MTASTAACLSEELHKALGERDAARLAADHANRQLAATTDTIGTADDHLDNVQHRLAQWVADGGTVDACLLDEVLDEVRAARRLLETAALRAVQA